MKTQKWIQQYGKGGGSNCWKSIRVTKYSEFIKKQRLLERFLCVKLNIYLVTMYFNISSMWWGYIKVLIMETLKHHAPIRRASAKHIQCTSLGYL